MLKIDQRKSVSSTMDVAREMLSSAAVCFDNTGVPSLAGVMAAEQTAGRGQRARTWHCPAGDCLCITYFCRHGLKFPVDIPKLSLLAGIAAVKGLENLRPTLDLGVKWPNDLILDSKKLGGILIETVRAPDGEWTALIGVGINNTVTEFPNEINRSATSLMLNGVTDVSLIDLAQQVGVNLNHLSGYSLNDILSEWRKHDKTVGIKFVTDTPHGSLIGIGKGVDDSGRLLLMLDSGETISVETASSLRQF